MEKLLQNFPASGLNTTHSSEEELHFLVYFPVFVWSTVISKHMTYMII